MARNVVAGTLRARGRRALDRDARVALLPRGEWAPLPGAGHMPWFERPEPMRERLRAFILGHQPGTSRR